MTETMTLPLPTDVPAPDQLAPADTAPETTPAPPPPADTLPGGKPPRRRRATKTTTDDAPKPARSRAKRSKPIDIAARMAELYGTMGALVAAVPSGPAAHAPELTVTQTIGLALVENAEPAAGALAQLAEDNPKMREALERLLTVSAFGAVVTAHLPIVLAAGLATGAVPAWVGKMIQRDDAGGASA